MTPDTKHRKQTFITSLSALHRNSTRSTGRNSSGTDEKPKNQWFQTVGGVTTRYLKEVHLINTMKGFIHKLNLAISHHDSVKGNFNLSFRTLDSIIESCEKWRPYLLNQESFDLLVCLEVLSMAKIHASVISARNFAEHQGAEGVCLKEDVSVPPLFTTVVSHHGQLQVFS